MQVTVLGRWWSRVCLCTSKVSESQWQMSENLTKVLAKACWAGLCLELSLRYCELDCFSQLSNELSVS